MNYIVLDLEYNSYWGSRHFNYITNKRFHEILQIGAVKLDENLNFIKDFNVYVNPKITYKIKSRVEKVTGITMEYLMAVGLRFPVVCKRFEEFIGKDEFQILVWSNGDLDVLKDNYDIFGISFKKFKNIKVIDIQRIYMNINRLTSTPSLKSVINQINDCVDDEYTFHSAHNDALYTVDVVRYMGVDKLLNIPKKLPSIKPSPIIIDAPKESFEQIKKHNNCKSCGKFSKKLFVTNKVKFDQSSLFIGTLFYCNRCNLFLSTKYIFNIYNKMLFTKETVFKKEEFNTNQYLRKELFKYYIDMDLINIIDKIE